MKKEELKGTTWFVFDRYVVAGQPKMESALMERAEKLLLYRLVAGEDLGNVIMEIEHSQDILSEQNPRWKKVDIRIVGGVDGLLWLHIGSQNLRLRKVVGELVCV